MPHNDDARETRIRETGQSILEQARASKPSMWSRQGRLQTLLEWSMRNDTRRIQFFRFVDLLPSLENSREITQRLHEYFLVDPSPLPVPFRWALSIARPGSPPGYLAAQAARHSVRFLARSFIAGETEAQAETSILRLRDHGMAFSIDVLGEATTSEREADEYALRYERLLTALTDSAKNWRESPTLDQGAHGPIPRVNLSIKLSALDPQFDPISPLRTLENVGRRLRPILHKAIERHAHIHIDMEDYAHKGLILSIFKSIFMENSFRAYPHVGIVLQAYLKECERDLNELLDWVNVRGTPITVRLVKGAYWDTEIAFAAQRNWPVPVFTQKWESDANFERLTQCLFQNREKLRPAIASHNVRSLAAALVTAEELGASPQEYEIQTLYGMGDPLKVALVRHGLLVRVYAPYGLLLPGMGYLIRRLLENTANTSFLRQGFIEDQPVEELLANPAEMRNTDVSPPQAENVEEQVPMQFDFDFANEPLTDFGLEENRRAMEKALEEVRHQSGDRLYPIIINGKPVLSSSTLVSFNPSHKTTILGRVASATRDNADEAVAAAREGWTKWRRVPVHERSERIRRAAALMRERRFELTAWIIMEAGKPWREADGDVAEAIDFCEFYSRLFERMHEQPRHRDLPGEKNLLVYESRGVAVIIAPWNFPLAILTGMTIAALMTGNAVIIKPAEQTPIIAAKFYEILCNAGIPTHAVHYLPGVGEEVGAHLVAHPGVDLIAFTGSKAVGLEILKTASATPGVGGPKKVIAEMGGKNAIIVDADADLDEAIKGTIASAFGYAGQKCSACSRLIVHQSVHDTLMRRLGEALDSIPVGAADDPATVVGPLIDEEAMKRVLGYIKKGQGEAESIGAASTDHETAAAEAGWFVSPTVFTRIPPESDLLREEIFGPVLVVQQAQSFDEALQIANATDYALTGGLYSRSPENIARAKVELNAGNLYINREITGAKVDRQPFGGFKMSGIGSKAGGPDYLLQFCVPKAITENVVRHGLTEDIQSR